MIRRADMAQVLWDACDALEGDDNKDLRRRLNQVADIIYQHEADEWVETMRTILNASYQPMAGFSFMPKGEVT